MLQALLQDLRGLDASRRSLRSFGFVVGGVATVVAGWLIWRSGSTDWPKGGLRPSFILAAIGLSLIALGAVSPRLLRPAYFVWMALAFLLGTVMTRIILTIVFVLLIIPIGLVMKLFGRDPLTRRLDRSMTSYWISREDMDRSPERLEKYY
ncbi:MAG TPA: SxtJ family membrane protein [Rhodothermales bacterium]|nr:SxtJ family membrane protein [Rhodothermales bacterium]